MWRQFLSLNRTRQAVGRHCTEKRSRWHLMATLLIMSVVLYLFPEGCALEEAPREYGVTYPMYTPGEAVTSDMLPTPHASYGSAHALYLCTANENEPTRTACDSLKKLDESFCKNVPAGISRTPHFSGKLLGSDFGGRFSITCGAPADWAIYDQYKDEAAPEGTVVVYTTNGTLPDIYGPSHPAPVTLSFSSGEESFIVARCIEPDAHPSRIAYVKRGGEVVECGNADNLDRWRIETDHKPLILPGCNARALGKETCDGQTIVEQVFVPPSPPLPSDTPSTNSPHPTPTHVQPPVVDAQSAAVIHAPTTGLALLLFGAICSSV